MQYSPFPDTPMCVMLDAIKMGYFQQQKLWFLPQATLVGTDKIQGPTILRVPYWIHMKTPSNTSVTQLTINQASFMDYAD